MSLKAFIYLCVFVFSSICGAIPVLFGGSFLSISSLVGNTIGGFLGVFVGYKLGKAIGLAN